MSVPYHHPFLLLVWHKPGRQVVVTHNSSLTASSCRHVGGRTLEIRMVLDLVRTLLRMVMQSAPHWIQMCFFFCQNKGMDSGNTLHRWSTWKLKIEWWLLFQDSYSSKNEKRTVSVSHHCTWHRGYHSFWYMSSKMSLWQSETGMTYNSRLHLDL